MKFHERFTNQRGFFSEANGHVLLDPRTLMLVADGRNFLPTTPDRYDMLISEPSNPWISGLAALFSEEFFRLASGRVESWFSGSSSIISAPTTSR